MDVKSLIGSHTDRRLSIKVPLGTHVNVTIRACKRTRAATRPSPPLFPGPQTRSTEERVLCCRKSSTACATLSPVLVSYLVFDGGRL